MREQSPVVQQERRDHRTAAFETIGCALAVLRRFDYIGNIADVRDSIKQVRSMLSLAQSKLKQRIDQQEDV